VDRRALVAVFFTALLLCALVTKSHVTGWNDGSRFATIDALTANHTFVIDGSPFERDLGDKIRFRGRTYSDKPPLLAVEGAGVALLLAPLGITLRHAPAAAIYAITLLTVGVWFALGCCYAYAFQRLLGFERRTAAAVAALTGAGTLALPYATVLANHVPCGAAALAGCYHLVRGRDGSPAQALLAGGFFGLAYAFDSAGVLLAIAGVVLLWGARPLRWVLCIAAVLPIFALQLAYNVSISGSVMPTVFNAQAWSDPSLPLHSWSSQIFGVFSPGAYLAFAVNLLVGSKGLFSFTPLMLVAGFGVSVMWRTGGLMQRLAVAIVSAAGAFFLAILFLQSIDIIAPSFGERRYVDLFFLLGIAFGPALAAVRSGVALLAVRLTIVVSVAIAALGTVAPFAGEGQSGFEFGSAAFGALARRSPIQAALDVLLLIVEIALVLWLVRAPLVAGSRVGNERVARVR
jgi:hypothetical protein